MKFFYWRGNTFPHPMFGYVPSPMLPSLITCVLWVVFSDVFRVEAAVLWGGHTAPFARALLREKFRNQCEKKKMTGMRWGIGKKPPILNNFYYAPKQDPTHGPIGQVLGCISQQNPYRMDHFFQPVLFPFPFPFPSPFPGYTWINISPQTKNQL